MIAHNYHALVDGVTVAGESGLGSLEQAVDTSGVVALILNPKRCQRIWDAFLDAEKQTLMKNLSIHFIAAQIREPQLKVMTMHSPLRGVPANYMFQMVKMRAQPVVFLRGPKRESPWSAYDKFISDDPCDERSINNYRSFTRYLEQFLTLHHSRIRDMEQVISDARSQSMEDETKALSAVELAVNREASEKEFAEALWFESLTTAQFAQLSEESSLSDVDDTSKWRPDASMASTTFSLKRIVGEDSLKSTLLETSNVVITFVSNWCNACLDHINEFAAAAAGTQNDLFLGNAFDFGVAFLGLGNESTPNSLLARHFSIATLPFTLIFRYGKAWSYFHGFESTQFLRRLISTTNTPPDYYFDNFHSSPYVPEPPDSNILDVAPGNLSLVLPNREKPMTLLVLYGAAWEREGGLNRTQEILRIVRKIHIKIEKRGIDMRVAKSHVCMDYIDHSTNITSEQCTGSAWANELDGQMLGLRRQQITSIASRSLPRLLLLRQEDAVEYEGVLDEHEFLDSLVQLSVLSTQNYERIMHVNHRNITAVSKETAVLLVVFSNNWCARCKKINTELQRASAILKKSLKNEPIQLVPRIAFFDVSDVSNAAYLKRHSILSFPIGRVYKKGLPHDFYTGSDQGQAIASHLLRYV